MASWSPKVGLEVIPESRLQRIQLGLLWLTLTLSFRATQLSSFGAGWSITEHVNITITYEGCQVFSFFFLNILFPFVSHPSPTQPCMETHCEKISPLSWLLWRLDRFISPARSVFPWLLIVECRRRWEVKAGSVFMSGWESESGAVSRTNRDAGLQLIVWRDKCPMRSTRRKRIWIYLKACGCDLKGNRNRKQQVYIF